MTLRDIWQVALFNLTEMRERSANIGQLSILIMVKYNTLGLVLIKRFCIGLKKGKGILMVSI